MTCCPTNQFSPGSSLFLQRYLRNSISFVMVLLSHKYLDLSTYDKKDSEGPHYHTHNGAIGRILEFRSVISYAIFFVTFELSWFSYRIEACVCQLIVQELYIVAKPWDVIADPLLVFLSKEGSKAFCKISEGTKDDQGQKTDDMQKGQLEWMLGFH